MVGSLALLSCLFQFFFLVATTRRTPSPLSSNLESQNVSVLQPRHDEEIPTRGVFVRLLLSPAQTQRGGNPIMYLRQPGGNGISYVVQYDTQVLFEGTSTDGPLCGGIFRSQMNDRPFASVLRAVDYSTRNSQRPVLPSDSLVNHPGGYDPLLLKVIPIGEVRYRNSELMNPETGRGILADSWFRINGGARIFYDPRWAVFGPNFDPASIDLFHRWSAAQYVQNLAEDLRIELPRTLQDVFEATTEEGISRLQSIYEDENPRATTVTSVQHVEFPESNEAWEVTEYNTHDVSNTETSSRGSPREERFLDFGEQDDVFSPCNSPRGRLGRDLNELELRGNLLQPRACLSKSVSGEVPKGVTTSILVFAHVKGVTSIIQSISVETVRAIGVIGLLTAPCFIILDLVNGDWQAASLATIGLVLGLAATEAIGGPIGFIVGGLLSAVFSILPGLFDLFKDPPPSNNLTKILQFIFFGDQDITGNEKCNENRKKANLEQNCTAVYGPGSLAKVFGWAIFDAIIFLIFFNYGYPMAILDIAAVFNVTDPTVNPGSNSPASIDCGEHFEQIITGGRYPSSKPGPLQSPSVGYPCGSPKFSIDRSKVTIPVINQTADIIYSRIIPAPNGDCKLVVQSPSGLYLPLYNTTFTGLPCAVACNVTQSVQINGTIDVIVYNYSQSFPNATSLNNANNGSGWSFPNSSTNLTTQSTPSGTNITSDGISSDGSSGRAFEPAPPPTAFKNLSSTDSACMSGDGGSICLPNGTYRAFKGSFGFDIGKSTDLTIPSGVTVNIFQQIEEIHFHQHIINVTFLQNETSSDSTFSTNARIFATRGGRLTILTPQIATPPCTCLFASTDFSGDVACYGTGGGNLSSQVQNMAQSMKVFGGANIWVYASSYNDTGGTLVNTDVSDLSSLPYGTNENFNSKIKALWVSPP